MLMFKQRLLLVMITWLASSSLALAGGGLRGGALEITQIANNVQLAGIQAKEIQQLVRLAQQVQNQLRMLQDIAIQARRLAKSDWGNAFQDLQRLAGIVRQGRALAYSLGNLDQIMRETYKGYKDYTGIILNQQTFHDRFRTWNETTMDTLRGTLKAVHLQSSQFQTEERTLTTLQGLSQSAQGRMQALQAGHQIAAQQVRQLQKLRQLQMAQMGMQAAFMAGEEDQKAAQQAAYEQFMKPAGKPVIGNETRYGPPN